MYSPQSRARGSTPNDVRLDRSRAPTARGRVPDRARAASETTTTSSRSTSSSRSRDEPLRRRVARARGDYNAAAETFVDSFFYDGEVDERDVERRGWCGRARET